MARSPKFNSTHVQKMREMYEIGGVSLAKIATDFGVSVPTISKYLRRAGVEIRKPGRPSGNEKPLTPVDDVQVDESSQPEDLGVESPENTTPVFRFN